MADTRYPFARVRYDESQLYRELLALIPPLPGLMGTYGTPGVVLVRFTDPLSPADQARLSAAVTAHTGGPRQPADRAAVRAAILGLTGAQTAELLREVAVDWLLANPTGARTIGIPIDGDTPVP